jgi:L-cysteine S-thiosulfotransferase
LTTRWKIAAVLSAAAIATSTLGPASTAEPGSTLVGYNIVDDAIPEPLSGRTGNAERGRKIAVSREAGNCLACHRLPEPEPSQGDLGPDLSQVGRRLTPGQIRLRLVDESRLNPATLMPPYYRVDGLYRVARQYQGKPVLTATEIEDVVAYLASLTR